jgi:hypothetical protein
VHSDGFGYASLNADTPLATPIQPELQLPTPIISDFHRIQCCICDCKEVDLAPILSPCILLQPGEHNGSCGTGRSSECARELGRGEQRVARAGEFQSSAMKALEAAGAKCSIK